jgi:antitoxin HicB
VERYPFDLHWSDEDQAWIADVYDLPGCLADGETPQEAASAAEEAARLWVEVARQEGRDIPPPSSEESASGQFVLRLPRSLHARLRRMAEREHVSLNQLAVALLAQREAERRT